MIRSTLIAAVLGALTTAGLAHAGDTPFEERFHHELVGVAAAVPKVGPSHIVRTELARTPTASERTAAEWGYITLDRVVVSRYQIVANPGRHMVDPFHEALIGVNAAVPVLGLKMAPAVEDEDTATARSR